SSASNRRCSASNGASCVLRGTSTSFGWRWPTGACQGSRRIPMSASLRRVGKAATPGALPAAPSTGVSEAISPLLRLLAARIGEVPNTSVATARAAQNLIDIVVLQSCLQHYFQAASFDLVKVVRGLGPTR